MSYILDALRKSEQERNRNAPPDLTTRHPLPPAQHSAGTSARALWLVGGALVLNALVLGIWLLWPTAAPPAPAQTQIDPALPAAAPSTPAPMTPAPVGVAGAGADAAGGEAPMAPERTEPSAGTAAAPGSEAATPAPRETAVAATDTTPPSASQTPAFAPQPAPVSIQDLPERIQRRIPMLSFSTHIYGDEARFREVGINGGRFAEGERVEGMRLAQITETGVVFDFEGYLFEVSVLQDWDY